MRTTRAFSAPVALLLAFCTSFTYAAGNNALSVNTNTQNNKTVQIAITRWGSDFYYAIMACMGATAIGILCASSRKPRSDRIFFYLSAALCFTACIAYFSMGSNLGWVPIDVEWVRGSAGLVGRNREIFYARYIDWVITTPLLLLDLCLTAGLPWPTILWTIALDEAMIVTGLLGALVKSRYKWGYYVFGCVAMFGVFWQLAVVGRASAARLGKDVYRVYLLCGVLTLVVWLLYPVAWGVCEGGNVISPNYEAVFYGILDFFAKPVFSIALIVGHWAIDPSRLGLRIDDYTDPEKSIPGPNANGVQGTNGHAHDA